MKDAISHYQRMPGLKTVVCLAVFAAVLLVRVPFLHNPLIDEEGTFAFMVASPTPSSQIDPSGLPRLFVANLGDTVGLVSPEHPILPYIFLESCLGGIVRRFNVLAQPPERRTLLIRLSFLSLFAIGIVGLVPLTRRGLSNSTPRECSLCFCRSTH